MYIPMLEETTTKHEAAAFIIYVAFVVRHTCSNRLGLRFLQVAVRQNPKREEVNISCSLQLIH